MANYFRNENFKNKINNENLITLFNNFYIKKTISKLNIILNRLIMSTYLNAVLICIKSSPTFSKLSEILKILVSKIISHMRKFFRRS